MKRSNKAVVDAKADTESAKRRRVEVSDFEPVDVSKLEGSKLDLADCETYYVAQFVDKATAMRWYNELLELDTWYQPTLRMYGRSFLQSRQVRLQHFSNFSVTLIGIPFRSLHMAMKKRRLR